MSVLFDAGSFSGVLPIFPLPDVVLFPHMLLPLHIFEPRYRQMVGDALERERLIGMALLKPGWEKNYFGSPPIQDRLGMGKIVQCERLEDGRYHLVLLGIQRVEVVELEERTPYRLARIELLQDVQGDSSSEDILALRRTLVAGYRRLYPVTEGQPAAESKIADPAVSLGALTDALAAVLPLKLAEKQRLLEEVNVVHRAKRIHEWIFGRIQALEFYSKGFRFDPGDPRLN
ncbi:MAG: LON peptidase substrate-binding domain-containing protein [Planctomycetes bacterium]|nr:LON peptidase substrate-binding domain-containing protein [Planctomycetota bacterium]